jgi:hypothetical protein
LTDTAGAVRCALPLKLAQAKFWNQSLPPLKV